MNTKFLVFLLVVLALITSVLFEGNSQPVGQATKPETITCSTDADCVPATCCHPNACLPKALKPDCEDTYCTAACIPGTLDCGQGSCACVEQKCVAKMTP